MHRFQRLVYASACVSVKTGVAASFKVGVSEEAQEECGWMAPFNG